VASLRAGLAASLTGAAVLFGTVLFGTSIAGSVVLGPRALADETAPRGAEAYFTDVVLVDHHGKRQRLYSDLMKGKTVVINAMFTSCSGSCPVMAARLERIQAWLGDRLGKEVHILSISVDPERDTPETMAAFAESFQARPGWYFLTGERDKLEIALRKLGQFVEDPENHQSVLLIGNEPTGLWKKALGMAPAEELIAILESVLEDRG
jgi:protein SCO1